MKFNKIIKFLSFNLLIPIASCSIYACSNNEENKNNKPENSTNNEAENKEEQLNDDWNTKEIFPQIKYTDYYDLIEFDKTNSPYIGTKLITKVVEDIFSRISTTKGDFAYKIINHDKKNITICCKWSYNGIEKNKNYNISIKN